VLGDGVHRIVADVGHRHAVLAAVADIDHIVAGGGHGDQLEVRQLPQCRLTQHHLVGDGDGRTPQPLHNLMPVAARVLDVIGCAVRAPDVGDERRAIEENHPQCHGWAPAGAGRARQ